MPQEPKFIDGTLLDNLIGLTEIEKDKMSNILKSVDLTEYINSHPQGIKMFLANRGEDMPFGIRKRIALARALAVSGQVVLLDEPTESIDERGRKAIKELIKKMIMNNKTVIISTQDENLIGKANVLINLDVKPEPEIIYIKKGI